MNGSLYDITAIGQSGKRIRVETTGTRAEAEQRAAILYSVWGYRSIVIEPHNASRKPDPAAL